MTMSRETWIASPGVEIPVDALEEFTRVCVKNSEYDFVSGGHGKDYVDLDELFGTGTSDDRKLKHIIDAATRRILALRESDGYDVLAFIETPRGPVGIVSARLLLAERTEMKTMIIRPYKRLLSQAAKPFALAPDARVLIVADVATTGRSISDAAGVLWRLNARRCGALALADRREGAAEFLASLDIPLHSVVVPPSQKVA